MENNEPSMVVMDYEVYNNLASQEQPAKVQVRHEGNGHHNGVLPKQNNREEEIEILERINKEILALKDEIEREEKDLVVAID